MTQSPSPPRSLLTTFGQVLKARKISQDDHTFLLKLFGIAIVVVATISAEAAIIVWAVIALR